VAMPGGPLSGQAVLCSSPRWRPRGRLAAEAAWGPRYRPDVRGRSAPRSLGNVCSESLSGNFYPLQHSQSLNRPLFCHGRLITVSAERGANSDCRLSRSAQRSVGVGCRCFRRTMGLCALQTFSIFAPGHVSARTEGAVWGETAG